MAAPGGDSRNSWRLTPQFSGRALAFAARRERTMKWRARAVAAMPYHGPLQLLVMRLRYAEHIPLSLLGDRLAVLQITVPDLIRKKHNNRVAIAMI
jgi:hypothetical protein